MDDYIQILLGVMVIIIVSSIAVAFQPGYVDTLVLFRDGSNSLTANWGVGGFNIDMEHGYVLECDFTQMVHFTMAQGVTDVTINIIISGFWSQDRHFHKIGFSVDIAPGVGKTVSCTITDGTNSITVSLTGEETSGSSAVGAFDLDVSAETFIMQYTQDAGGSSTKGFAGFLYHYKINE